MEYRIEHRGLIGFENMSFAVDIVKLTKSAKNRSYPNLSNCCKVPLKQKKFCGSCQTETTDSSEFKQFKLGKETFSVSATHLDQIKKSLDDDRIIITEFRQLGEVPDLYYSDVLFAGKQHKKYSKDYLEYSAILQQTGKVGVGMLVYRERPYPVMLYPYRGILMLRCLRFAEEVNAVPMVDTTLQVNEQKVQLMGKVMQHNIVQAPFTMDKFVNIRANQEEDLIEKVIKGEALPEVKEVVSAPSVADNDEIARLQALLSSTPEPVVEEKPKEVGLNAFIPTV